MCTHPSNKRDTSGLQNFGVSRLSNFLEVMKFYVHLEFYLFMYVAILFESIITTLGISKNYRAFSCRTFHKRLQALNRSISDTLHPDFSKSFGIIHFDCNCNDQFSPCTTTTFSSWVFSSDQGSISFTTAAQFISSMMYNNKAHFMEPTPSGLIDSQTKNLLKSQIISIKILTRYVPNNMESKLERLSCSLRNSSSGEGNIMQTSCTSNQICPNFPAVRPPANWANRTLRASEPQKIVVANLFCTKPFVKFLQCLRVIHTASWMNILLPIGQV